MGCKTSKNMPEKDTSFARAAATRNTEYEEEKRTNGGSHPGNQRFVEAVAAQHERHKQIEDKVFAGVAFSEAQKQAQKESVVLGLTFAQLKKQIALYSMEAQMERVMLHGCPAGYAKENLTSRVEAIFQQARGVLAYKGVTEENIQKGIVQIIARIIAAVEEGK
jgi:hypothetical protein